MDTAWAQRPAAVGIPGGAGTPCEPLKTPLEPLQCTTVREIHIIVKHFIFCYTFYFLLHILFFIYKYKD